MVASKFVTWLGPRPAALAGCGMWNGRLVGDAGSLEARDGSFDYVVSGLVINFVPGIAAAIAEMIRVARRGGRVAAYVWDYAGGMQMLRYFWDAASELDPDAAALDHWDPFLGARVPAPTYSRSLDAQAREGLRDLIRGRLPADDRGRISLVAKAWAVCGEVRSR